MQTPNSVGFNEKWLTIKKAPKELATPLMVVRYWIVRSEILGSDVVARYLESVSSRLHKFSALYFEIL